MRTVLVGIALAAASAATHRNPDDQIQTPASAGTAAISGTVTDAATGRPLAGAVVTLRLNVGPARERTRRMRTDEHGRFVFMRLPADDACRLETSHFAYVEGAYGQVAMLAPAARIALGEGEWFAEADIRMWRAGSISGRVVDELGDPMVGVWVRALARAHVAGRPWHLSGPAASTDDRGEYRLAGLPPGAYVIVAPAVQSTVPEGALAGGYDFGTPRARDLRLTPLPPRPRMDAALDPVEGSRLIVGDAPVPPTGPDTREAYGMTFHPASAAIDGASTIDVGPGQAIDGIDVTVRPGPVASVLGRVESASGLPEGFVLRLVPAGLEEAPPGGEVATAMVASDGRFAFLNVPAGDYVVHAGSSTLELTYLADDGTDAPPSAPGMSPRSATSRSAQSGPPGAGYVRRREAGDDGLWVRMPLAVGAGDTANVVVTLQAAFTLNGRFVYDGSTRLVAVTAATGAVGGRSTELGVEFTPMPRPDRAPVVTLEPADGAPYLGVPSSNPFADDIPEDRFVVEGLRDGDYVLRAPSGNAQFSVKSIVIDGVDYTHQPFDASALDAGHEAVLTLTNQVNVVSGVVRGAAGAPVDAAVIAFPVERDQWRRYGFSPVRIMAAPVAAVDGYSLRGLPAGEYFLIAVEPTDVTAWQDPAFLDRAAGRARRLTLGWGQEQVIDLPLERVR